MRNRLVHAVLLLAVVAGCDRRDEGEGRVRDAFADSVAAGIDAKADPPVPPPVTSAPADRTATASGSDSAAFATSPDLAALSATLEVPVQGIARSQLRDTYAEARGDRIHEALDIPAARGTPVLSATDGRLLRLFNSRAGGLMVYATDTSERFILLYGHLDRYADGLSDGMRLVRGQVIGYVGTTGNAPAGTPHLHFGILRGNPDVSWSDGEPVNPYPLLVPARPSR